MKFSTCISVFTLALGVVSGTAIVQRDLATIQNVLTTVSKQVDQLDAAVKAFSGNTSPVTTASSNLISTLNSGTQTISKTTPLSVNDALGIASFVQGLSTSVNNSVSDLIAKKSAFVTAGAGQLVLQSLQDLKTASQALSNAITSKVPAEVQTIAAQLSGAITDSLQGGINAYQGAGGAPTSSSKAAPTTTIPSSTGKSSPTATAAPTGKSSPTATSAPTGKPSPTATSAPTGKPSPTATVAPADTALPSTSQGSEPSITNIGTAPSSTSCSSSFVSPSPVSELPGISLPDDSSVGVPPSLPTISAPSEPYAPGSSETFIPAVTDGSEPTLTYAPGGSSPTLPSFPSDSAIPLPGSPDSTINESGSVPTPTGGSSEPTPVTFTGSATQNSRLGASTLVLLAAAVGLFA